MKTLKIIFYFLITPLGLFAQWQNTNPPYTFNNVGIGTSTPSGLLHLKTLSGAHYWSSHNFGINLVIDGPHHNSIGFLDTNSSNPFAITNITGKLTISKMPALGDVSTPPAHLMAIGNDGNVGIGSDIPSGLLHLKTPAASNYWSNSNFGVNLVIDGAHHNSIAFLDASSSNPFAITNISGKLTISKMPALGDVSTSPTYLMSIGNDGNVGIGTAAPGSFKLAVEGKIGAREVNVTTANPWPDYVFEPTYTLPSLDSVQSYINQNKHLPEVPSAKETEANGVNLGEMNMLLLKKVEELTLYLLQQNARIDELSKLTEQQGKELNKIKLK